MFCSFGDFKKHTMLGIGVLTVTTSTTTYLQNKYKAKESHVLFCVFGLRVAQFPRHVVLLFNFLDVLGK